MAKLLRKSLQEAYESYETEIPTRLVEASFSEGIKRSGTEIVPLYSFQNIIRPLFGKGMPQPPTIGDHPGFIHLKGTKNIEYCSITTLFMDIESSTRLSLLYELPQVYKIKNAFICAAIEIIKAFDGHVHRIMGDAVMAFFGGPNNSVENSAIDALNCATVLRYFVDAVIKPELSTEGFDDPFGVRIGVDHGKREDVLWSSYGYPGMEEVTATSFYVDVASKLQHAASRNQIMIGASIRAIIDFPDKLLRIKTVVKNENEYQIPFLQPNHTDRNGNSINYRQFLLNWEEYLQLTSIVEYDDTLSAEIMAVPLTIDIFSEKETGIWEKRYLPSAFGIPKGKWLLFKLGKEGLPAPPFNVTFKVENHGAAAKEASDNRKLKGEETTPFENHETTYPILTKADIESLKHWEATAFLGLHFMTVSIEKNGKNINTTTVGIYVL